LDAIFVLAISRVFTPTGFTCSHLLI